MNNEETNTNRSAEEHTSEPKKEVRSRNWPVGDIMISLFFLAYASFMFVGALNFTTRAQMGKITSPKFTPILLSTLVVIFSITLIIATLRKHRGISIPGWFREVFTDERMQRSFILVGIMTVYIVLIGIVDFLIINLLYFLVVYSYLKIGRWTRIIIYSAACTVIVAIIVPYVFNMPTP